MLRLEWDEEKDKINRKKHRIGFETAKLVFDDPGCLTFVGRVEGGEERWHAIGLVTGRAMVTVVHTYRPEGPDDIIRIVSARRADAQERKLYAENSLKGNAKISWPWPVSAMKTSIIRTSPRFGRSRQMGFVADSIAVMLFT